MTDSVWTVIGAAVPVIGGLATLILQNYYAALSRAESTRKLDSIGSTITETKKAVDGHLTNVTTELAVTSRALATSTGSFKDNVTATINEKNASDLQKTEEKK